jgi:hypothetical protein
MTAPLGISVDVACAPEHALAVWTARIDAWWPADHTVSGHPTRVVLETEPGGRITECTADGAERDWGTITAWDPPRRPGYSWHLTWEPAEATEVEIRLVPVASERIPADIDHGGWDRLGAASDDLRARNRSSRDTLLPHVIDAIDHGDR